MSEPSGGYFVGLISGTSVDGIDAVLCAFEPQPRTLAALALPWPDALRSDILAVAQGERALDLDAYGRLDVSAGQRFAEAALAVVREAGLAPAQIAAIGSHGQTIRHRPDGPLPFSLQIGDPSVIAERTGIDTVADFRRADVAAGGQGAPLMPAFHEHVLAADGARRAVLNLGGIANLTLLAPDAPVLGFDTGPANGLMDAWCQHVYGEAFDRAGAMAASGHVDATLLAALRADPYFDLAPPKSTGREHFHLAWLQQHARAADLPPRDVQATLMALTVETIVDALRRLQQPVDDVVACGGGVHNDTLMAALAEALAPLPVRSSAELGVDPDYVEAAGFAWLAYRRLHRLPGNLPAVTGARGARLLGAVYAAPR